ncbi:MAG: nitrogen fixation protein FixH [Gammaproteobacteria bacterium]|nr:MAG: nitrogen fixation protein FixH [Gammaproteobacteria bacterium]
MTETMQKSKPRISQENKEAFRNPWVLGWIAAITLVLLVNVAFIVTAIVTNPGLVDKNYYEKGRDLEREFITLQETRNRLGWQMKLEAVSRPVIDQPARYTFSVVDKAGVPVDGDHAVLRAYRPSDAASDFEMEMQEIAPGIYSAELTFPLKGIWDLIAILHRGEDALKVSRRISVQAQ